VCRVHACRERGRKRERQRGKEREWEGDRMEVNNTHNIIVSVVGNNFHKIEDTTLTKKVSSTQKKKNSHKIEDSTLTKKVSSTHNIRMRVQQIHIASNQKS
jgi:hypothetical protein